MKRRENKCQVPFLKWGVTEFYNYTYLDRRKRKKNKNFSSQKGKREWRRGPKAHERKQRIK